MNNRSVASLSLKLLGIYAIILALPYTQMLPCITHGLHERANSPRMIVGYLAPFLLLIVTGTTLICFSAKLSGLLVSTPDSQSKPEVSTTDIQSIAFSIAGVVITAEAIPKITQIVTNISGTSGSTTYGIVTTNSQNNLVVCNSCMGQTDNFSF